MDPLELEARVNQMDAALKNRIGQLDSTLNKAIDRVEDIANRLQITNTTAFNIGDEPKKAEPA